MQFKANLALFALATLVHGLAQSTDVDIPCEGSTFLDTEVVGDGNPHQNFIFKQVSPSTDCDDNPNGSAAVTSGLTVGWSASLGFAADFITGGFNVMDSTSTGTSNSFGCQSNSGTHTGSLCVFERIQVTAFTAKSRTCTRNSCGSDTCGDYSTGVIFAPNSQQGSCYYDNFQLNLPCGLMGSEQHINMGPAGGPQFIACNPSQA